MRTAHAEGGAASLWVVAGCALVLVAASTVQIRTTAVLARHRAEAAADLAALAAGTSIGTTAEPCAAAARIAEINGARLTSCALRLDPSGRAGTVRVLTAVDAALVIVGHRHVTASARAERAAAQSGPSI